MQVGCVQANVSNESRRARMRFARVRYDQRRRLTDAGGDIGLCDRVGSGEGSVAASLVRQDVDCSQSSMGPDQPRLSTR
jgi:hypothetical protein